jgi:hypothetical protein
MSSHLVDVGQPWGCCTAVGLSRGPSPPSSPGSSCHQSFFRANFAPAHSRKGFKIFPGAKQSRVYAWKSIVSGNKTYRKGWCSRPCSVQEIPELPGRGMVVGGRECAGICRGSPVSLWAGLSPLLSVSAAVPASSPGGVVGGGRPR